MAKKQPKSDDPIERELDSIKRLLILLLMKKGTPQGEIAKALGVGQSTVSRMMPAKALKPLE